MLFGLCAAAVSAGILFVVRAVRPPDDTVTATPTDAASAKIEGALGSSAEPELAMPDRDAPRGRRELAAAGPESVTEDPCASVTAELRAALTANEEAERQIQKLREKLAELSRELNALRFPEDTPYGAFLASPEAEEIMEDIRRGSHLYEALLADLRDDVRRYRIRMAEDPSYARFVESASNRLQRFSEDRDAAVDHLLRGIKAELDSLPVMLRPGEATWLAEQLASGAASDEELIHFLGPARLAAEIPLDKLFEDYLWDEDYGPALQAALPPEKRAALDARLHALMEESNDPEEVAWLLERFPTFFD